MRALNSTRKLHGRGGAMTGVWVLRPCESGNLGCNSVVAVMSLVHLDGSWRELGPGGGDHRVECPGGFTKIRGAETSPSP
jgi:hypothetical protein